MSFRVDTAVLKGLPDQLDRLKGDALHGRTYVQEQTSVGWEGLLNEMKGGHEHVVEELTTWLQRLGDNVAGASADGVRSVLQHYNSVDAQAAARVDATYPEAEVPPTDEGYTYYAYSQTASFGDKVEPEDRYQAVPDYNAEFPYEPHWADAGSPAQLSRDIVWEATSFCAWIGILDRAYDPYEDLCKPFVGDWAGFRGCADVFTNLADACSDMSVNTHWGARSIEFCWQGNAAGQCEAHVFAIKETLDETEEPLRELAEQYKEAAHGMHELGMVLGDVISDVIDACIICAAESALAAATSETVVGGVLFGGAAVYEAYEVVKGLMECFELVRKAKAIVETYNSMTHNFGAIEAEVALPALPEFAPVMPDASGQVHVSVDPEG